jgi:hypothetical protein
VTTGTRPSNYKFLIAVEDLWGFTFESVADLFANNFYLGNIFSFAGFFIYIKKIPREQKTPIATYRQTSV